ARLDGGGGHPDAETTRMMVAAIVVLGEFPLRIVGAAKFTTPDHERILEKPAGFKVGEQGIAGLVHVLTLAANGFGEIAMLVPTGMIELNETDIALSQAASEQTIGGKGARILGLLAVKLEDAFRLFRKVHDLGDASLHAICHLVLSDALIDLRVAEVLGLKGMQDRKR